MSTTTTVSLNMDGICPYCSSGTTAVYHSGKCPKVKSIEYYENGRVKKVNFITPADYISDPSNWWDGIDKSKLKVITKKSDGTVTTETQYD